MKKIDNNLKKTLLEDGIVGLPDSLSEYVKGAAIYDSSSSPEARVYFIDRDGGLYLKRSACGALKNEAVMTAYYHKIGLGAEIVSYVSGESDWLLTTRVRGENCTHHDYMSEPKRLADTLGTLLRELHELDFSGCPIDDRSADYLAMAERNYISGDYDKSHFPDSFGYASAEDAIRVLHEGAGGFRREVLLHGDFCLPNIMLDNWQLSGYIDLGCGGVGDRHIDIFWGIWTLGFNLGTDKYRDRFIDAYGPDKVSDDMLRVVAAAEVFG